MTSSGSREFRVDVTQSNLGHLLVTDAELLIKPPMPGQYPASAPHDSGHINQIMDFGDQDMPGELEFHIVTALPAQQAHRLLDRGWHTYIDYYCMAKVWIDARVKYVGAYGEILLTKKYGFEDGRNTARIYVYTREHWAALGNPDPAQSDWSHLIGLILDEDIAAPLFPFELEDRLSAGLTSRGPQKLVIVRPADTADGFSARGFELLPSDNDSY